jgi:hypothetical protein
LLYKEGFEAHAEALSWWLDAIALKPLRRIIICQLGLDHKMQNIKTL